MSFQTLVTQRLAAITQMLNAITTNAKKIDELPEQAILNPNSRIQVSINGISQRLDVQKLISTILNDYSNKIISIGNIAISGNSITIPLNAQWRINTIVYNTAANTVINIPFAAAGFIRKDIIVANTLSQIIRISGSENSGIAIAPNVPIDTVFVTEIFVTENSITNPNPPVYISEKPLYAKWKIEEKAPGNTGEGIEFDDLARGRISLTEYCNLGRYLNLIGDNNVHNPLNYEILSNTGLVSQ